MQEESMSFFQPREFHKLLPRFSFIFIFFQKEADHIRNILWPIIILLKAGWGHIHERNFWFSICRRDLCLVQLLSTLHHICGNNYIAGEIKALKRAKHRYRSLITCEKIIQWNAKHSTYAYARPQIRIYGNENVFGLQVVRVPLMLAGFLLKTAIIACDVFVVVAQRVPHTYGTCAHFAARR